MRPRFRFAFFPASPGAAAGVRKRLPLAFSVLSLSLFSLFLFSSTDGNLGIWGDDVLILTKAARLSRDYLHTVAGRGFLEPFYIWLYQLSGSDAVTMHRLGLAGYLATGFLGF